MKAIFSKLRRYPPRYGPEWGSGGIFGLRYHKETLYFTLAFEGEAHFITRDEEKIYNYELIGDLPTSGGDTYNAVDAVDEYIYFGGWVHAPARFAGKTERGSTISFMNKYSHVHEYDIEDRKVRLLWKDSIHHETEWAGEISEIIYDPVEDTLLLSRLDGHRNLGVYQLERRGGKVKILSDAPSLKGTLLNEYACFDHSNSFLSIANMEGIMGIQCLDLITRKWERHTVKPAISSSVDGSPILYPITGCMSSALNRLFIFIRGGLLVGNPMAGEEIKALRLFDFLSGYGPLRTVALPFGGGILVAFNAYTHGIARPSVSEDEVVERLNRIVGPTVLLYITPPSARIVGVFGARVTSLEVLGHYLLVGTSTMANVGAQDASPYDTGHRLIIPIRISEVLRQSPPVTFKVPGYFVGGKTFGGIPLEGYMEPEIIIRATKDNTLEIYEYDISLPPDDAEREVCPLKKGKNVIDLSSFRNIVSFKLLEPDARAKIKITLR